VCSETEWKVRQRLSRWARFVGSDVEGVKRRSE